MVVFSKCCFNYALTASAVHVLLTLDCAHSTVVKGFKVLRLNSPDWLQLGASHAPSQPDCWYNPGVVVELFVLFSGCQLTVLMLGAQ